MLYELLVNRSYMSYWWKAVIWTTGLYKISK